MMDLEDDGLYTCFVCGEIMKKDGNLLVCPCCEHEIEEEDYYNEGDAYKQCVKIDEQEEELWEMYSGLPEMFIDEPNDEEEDQPVYGVDRIATGW